MRCLSIGSPVDYETLVEGAQGVRFLKRSAEADLVHLFCPDRRTLDKKIGKAIGHVADKGMIWISWPKKSSKLFKDLVEDDLRTVVLPTGWVDVKVCAVDADWSGLKFLRRRT
jgi:hypothetical protein